MTKKKKQKTLRSWIIRGSMALFALLVISIFANLLVEPIGRHLISKHAPTLGRQIPKNSLSWNLWNGVHIKGLELKNLSPIFKTIKIKHMWINISYFSLLGKELELDHIQIEGLELISKYSPKSTLNHFSQGPQKLIHQEFRKLLEDASIQVIQTQLKDPRNKPFLRIDQLNLSTLFYKNQLELEGNFTTANLLGLEVRDLDYHIHLQPQNIKVNIPNIKWKGGQIQLKSNMRRKRGILLHESDISFKKLPLKHPSELLFEKYLPFNPQIKGHLNAEGKLFDIKAWRGQGELSTSSFEISGMNFQNTPLIKKQMPLLSSINVKELTLPQFSFSKGKISWDKLTLKGQGLNVSARGHIDLASRFYLKGITSLDQETYEELPTLSQTAFDLVEDRYQVPIELKGDFNHQEILNMGSIMRNAVGKQFQSIGSGLRRLFSR